MATAARPAAAGALVVPCAGATRGGIAGAESSAQRRLFRRFARLRRRGRGHRAWPAVVGECAQGRMRIGKSIPYTVEKTVAKLEAMALADDIRRDLIMVLRTGAVPR